MILLRQGTVDTELSAPFKKNVPEGKLFARVYVLEAIDLKDVTLKKRQVLRLRRRRNTVVSIRSTRVLLSRRRRSSSIGSSSGMENY